MHCILIKVRRTISDTTGIILKREKEHFANLQITHLKLASNLTFRQSPDFRYNVNSKNKYIYFCCSLEEDLGLSPVRSD